MKSEVMTTAHKIARKTRNNFDSYRAAFAIALKNAWSTIKNQISTIMEKVADKVIEITEDYEHFGFLPSLETGFEKIRDYASFEVYDLEKMVKSPDFPYSSFEVVEDEPNMKIFINLYK